MSRTSIPHPAVSGNRPLLTEAVLIARGLTPRRPIQAHLRALLRANLELSRAAELLLAASRRAIAADGAAHPVGCPCAPCGLRQAVEMVEEGSQ